MIGVLTFQKSSVLCIQVLMPVQQSSKVPVVKEPARHYEWPFVKKILLKAMFPDAIDTTLKGQ